MKRLLLVCVLLAYSHVLECAIDILFENMEVRMNSNEIYNLGRFQQSESVRRNLNYQNSCI